MPSECIVSARFFTSRNHCLGDTGSDTQQGADPTSLTSRIQVVAMGMGRVRGRGVPPCGPRGQYPRGLESHPKGTPRALERRAGEQVR